jgi:ribosomal protein S18 acetylase RimI-like enzyme
MHPARVDELAAVWPAVARAGVFGSFAAFERFHAAAPWRVQVGALGDVVVVRPWRGQPVLAMTVAVAPPRRIRELVEAVRAVAAAHGYERVLSPLVHADVASAWEHAGMERLERLVALRFEGPAPNVPEVAGLAIRVGTRADVAGLLVIDGASFPPLWAYDEPTLAELFATDRVAVAELDGIAVGYSSLRRHGADEAVVGRLAVAPAVRGAGIGTALLSDAVAAAFGAGAAYVTLTTQTDNVGARTLYGRFGFKELRGELVLLGAGVDGRDLLQRGG